MKLVIIIFTAFFKLNIAQAEIRLGVIPGGHPENLRLQARELATLLQEKLNEPVTIVVSKDYGSLRVAFIAKKVDFAFFSPQVWVQTDNEIKTKVLLKKVWKEPFYYSALISKERSQIRKLSDIKSVTKFVFVDRNSTSGYLYPQAMLSRLKKNPQEKNLIFAGSHAKAIELLESDKAEVAAVFSDDSKGNSGAWTQFSKNSTGYRVLWISEPIPTDPFCVRDEFYEKNPKMVHRLMYALIEIMETKEGQNKFNEILGSAQLVPATNSHYQSVKQVLADSELATSK
ncbi:MAG: phosphate/phosphite/phosphonate ABC transporter substrate-binding protein [Bdellovibrionia bacterium]